MEENRSTDWGTAADLRAYAALVAGARPLDDPALSPLMTNVEGLPPVLLHAGAAELICADIIAMAKRLDDAGVATELVVWPQMVHCFQFFAQFLPLAQEAIDALAAFVIERRASDGA